MFCIIALISVTSVTFGSINFNVKSFCDCGCGIDDVDDADTTDSDKKSDKKEVKIKNKS